MLNLFNDRESPLGVLPLATNIHRTQDLKGTDTLEFNYPLYHIEDGEEVENEIAAKLKNQYFIITSDQKYVIKSVEPSNGTIAVKAVVYTDELTNVINLAFSRPDEYLYVLARNALTGSGWDFITNIPNVKRSLAMKQSTALDIMKKLSDLFMTDLVFNAKDRLVYLNQDVAENKGVIFDDKFNLLNIQVTYDTTDLITRLIPVGKDELYISDINDGLRFIENYQYTTQQITAFWANDQYTDANALKEDAVKKLEILSQPKITFDCTVLDMARLGEIGEAPNGLKYTEYSFNLGDKVTIKDRNSHTLQTVRIVQMVTYPEEPEKNTLQLNSEYELMEDYFSKITAVDEILSEITTADGGVDGSKVDEISGDKVDSIDWTKVQNVQIVTAQIEDAQITRAKIGDAAIGTAQIEDATITTAKIGDAQITDAKIFSLNANKIVAGTIDASKITVTNLDADNITVGYLKGDRIAANTITGNLISGRTITADKIAANSITATEMQVGTITATSGIIADAAIGTAQIQDLSVTGAKIATATIDTVNIKNGAITNALIGTSAIDTAQIADGSITDAKIVGLTASKITAGTLDAGTIDVINLNAANITVGTINGQQIASGAITNTNIANGTIEKIKISQAFIDNLNATYASIDNLNATNATITNLTSNFASIQTLVSGNITSANMAAGAIQAGDATIANGAISSAQIISLDVAKLNAGNISTNKFAVVSDSGNLKIQENTLHVWDDSGKERISLGLNNNDYSLLVRGSDGTTVLFGADGVTHEGITNGAIDDSKISDDANINGGKLDIESVFYKMNNAPGYGDGGYGDGGYGDESYTLKSNKIFFNDTSQTLDVAFNSLKTTVSDTSSLVSNQGTSISVMQGQIANKIWNTDINTAINGVNDQITTISNNYSTLNQTVSGISTTVGSIQSSLNNATTRIATAESNITQNANNIALKVSQTDYTGNTIASLINQTATTVTIDASKINLNGYVTVSSLQSGGTTIIDGSRIQTGTINASLATIINLNASNINTGSMSGNFITANTITGSKLVADAITSREIASQTITANEIASNTITAAEIATGAITATNGIIASIDAGKISTGTLDADKITVINLTANQLQARVLEGAINSGVVTFSTYNRSYYMNSWGIYNPSPYDVYNDSYTTQFSNDQYNYVSTFDGVVTGVSGPSGYYPVILLKYNVLNEYQRQYGTISGANKIAILKQAVTNMKFSIAAEAVNEYDNNNPPYPALQMGFGIFNQPDFTYHIMEKYTQAASITIKTFNYSSSSVDLAGCIDPDGYVQILVFSTVASSTANSMLSAINPDYFQFSITFGSAVQYGTTLIDAMPDINGGRIYIYNNDGDKNVTIGSSGFSANNYGGTLILHDNNENHKVEMGISSQYSSGLINVYGSSTSIVAALYANNMGNGPAVILSNGGVYHSVLDTDSLNIMGNTIVDSGHLSHIGRGSAAYTTTISLGSNATTTIQHNLGYYPIVQFDGNTGNRILTVAHSSTSQLTISNYSSGGNTWAGTVRLY